MNTTTIEITTEQKDRLDDRKRNDREPYKAVLERLLGDDDGPEVTATVTPELDADAVDDLVAQLQDRIDVLAYEGAVTDGEAERIISTLQTVEERTGRLEKMLEDMGVRR